MDTKLKDKIKRTAITILILTGGLILCLWLYQLFDELLNGVVLTWLDSKFVQYDWIEPDSQGKGYYRTSIRWWRVKEYLFRGFIFLVLFSALAGRLVMLMYAAKREKKVLADAGHLIGDYMKHDRDAAEVFPVEFAEISVQMAEIKANIQRHEQVLKEEAGRKNDLITYLAHDLKTPLTSIVGYLSLLEEAPDMPSEQKAKYVHITLDKALRLEKLINEFFEITRYNLQQIVLEKETVDLGFMLMQMTDEFYPILNAHGNTVKLELPKEADGLKIYADAEKLARVFNNILKNAVAYSYPDTEIMVRCEESGEKVRIIFQNRGKTIPRQKLDSIFEKFFRLDDARTTNSGGAGLGLAIAKEIVTLHGGTITAQSDNEVTAFIVELPV
ncbi:MAG: sensor histidine kinase [Acetatifactor sp.]